MCLVLQPKPAGDQATPDAFAAGKYLGRCRVFPNVSAGLVRSTESSVPPVIARIGVRRAREEEIKKKKKRGRKSNWIYSFLKARPQSSSHLPLHHQRWFFLKPAWDQWMSYCTPSNPGLSHWNKSLLFHIFKLTTYTSPICMEKSGKEARCLGEKAENRSSLAMPLRHRVLKKMVFTCS